MSVWCVVFSVWRKAGGGAGQVQSFRASLRRRDGLRQAREVLLLVQRMAAESHPEVAQALTLLRTEWQRPRP